MDELMQEMLRKSMDRINAIHDECRQKVDRVSDDLVWNIRNGAGFRSKVLDEALERLGITKPTEDEVSAPVTTQPAEPIPGDGGAV